MEIHTSRFDLDHGDVERIYRMIKAQNAREELIDFNYFQEIIPQDYERLKSLCEFDFSTEPQKWADEEKKEHTAEYLHWVFAMNELCDMCINIFDLYYNTGCDYSPKYTEKYTLEERMKLWSEYEHKDDDEYDKLFNSLIDEAINNMVAKEKEK